MLEVIALAAATAAALAVVILGRAARGEVARHETRLQDLSRRRLADLFLFVSPETLVRGNALAFVVVLAVCTLLTGSPLVAVPVALATTLMPFVAVRWLRQRRLNQLVQQLPDALDSLAMSLRAGAGLPQALAQLAQQQPVPISQEFALVVREQHVGRSIDEALLGMTRRVPLQEWEMLVTTVRIARETGGGLAEALDRLASTLRRRLALEGKIRALTAQGRIQGVIVALLPLVIMLALYWLQPESMQALFTTPMGWVTLAVVAALELLGYWLIRRIVDIRI